MTRFSMFLSGVRNSDEVAGRVFRRARCLRIAGIAVLIFCIEACHHPSDKTEKLNAGPPVKVEPVLIARAGAEHFANAVYRRATGGPRIAASGRRILEWPIQASAQAAEVVRPGSENFQNGACALDVDGDGIDEMIAGRTAEDQLGTELLWFEEVPGQRRWKEHIIARVIKGEKEEGIHDIQPFEAAVSGQLVKGIAVVAGRRRLCWYEIPGDAARPWTEHFIADLGESGAAAAQSGLSVGDVAGNGRPDVVCGNYWAECPADPAGDRWAVHRYSRWDERATPNLPGLYQWVIETRFGGMNQLGLGDMDGDGRLDIVAADAEIPEARVGVFCQNAADPPGLWIETPVDAGVYCPHSLVVTDVDADGRTDILVGEMTAGGWRFPRNLEPKLYLYLNKGRLKFERYILHTGWGTHMMGMIPRPRGGQVFVFAADEIQAWYEDMMTQVVGWSISPVKER